MSALMVIFVLTLPYSLANGPQTRTRLQDITPFISSIDGAAIFAGQSRCVSIHVDDADFLVSRQLLALEPV